MSRGALAFVLLAAVGCARHPAVRSAPRTGLPAVTATAVSAQPLVQAPPTPEPIRAPDGYVQMRAVQVAPLPQGDAVLLADDDATTVLPIFVGGTEALSIAMRLSHESVERPLTHDLFDSLMRELGGSVAKVKVDELRGSTFIGSVWIRHGSRLVPIDARPSDAIALAIGADAPIYVARSVVTVAGLTLGNAPPPTAGLPPLGPADPGNPRSTPTTPPTSDRIPPRTF